jgi:hypothetical protein
MKRAADANWDRLAFAALNARDELRNLIPALDQEIRTHGDPRGILAHTRRLVCRHADGLRMALKHPTSHTREREGIAL